MLSLPYTQRSQNNTEITSYLCKAGRIGSKANQQAMLCYPKPSLSVALNHGMQLGLRECVWERQGKNRRESYTVASQEIIHFLTPVHLKEILRASKEAVRLNGLGTCKWYWCGCLIGCFNKCCCIIQPLTHWVFSSTVCLLRIILLGILLARAGVKLSGAENLP